MLEKEPPAVRNTPTSSHHPRLTKTFCIENLAIKKMVHFVSPPSSDQGMLLAAS